MRMEIGRVVRSNAGHDGDRFYVIVEADAEYAYIADGKRRKLAKPKRKNFRHLSKINRVLDPSEMETDRKLRQALHDLNDPQSCDA